jgi:hypothetical protein
MGKEKESRARRGRITRAIILRVRGRSLPTSPFLLFLLLLLFLLFLLFYSSLATLFILASTFLVSCLARFSSILLPRRRCSPAAAAAAAAAAVGRHRRRYPYRRNRRCVIARFSSLERSLRPRFSTL